VEQHDAKSEVVHEASVWSNTTRSRRWSIAHRMSGTGHDVEHHTGCPSELCVPSCLDPVGGGLRRP